MGLSSAFKQRLEEMELTRNQRLAILQTERELQARKSEVLASKQANIRYMEQRCLMLDQKIASQNFRISVLKSELENLDYEYQKAAQKLRAFKSEVEELEESESQMESFYEVKSLEMKDFRRNAESFKAERRMEVEELRKRIDELKSNLEGLQAYNFF